MIYRSLVIALLVLCTAPHMAYGQLLPSLGGDRAGTSGFQFLKIPIDARSAALGETVVANISDVSALFWNPALAAQLDNIHFGASHVEYFSDVTLNFAGASFHLPGSSLTLGVSIQTLSSGTMDVTTEFQPFGTGETFSLFDMALGLTVAQHLTDLFSYGVTAKYVQESVAGVTQTTAVFDIGIFYRVGDTGAQMAVAVRNFGLDSFTSGEISRNIISDSPTVLENDFESITPPTTFLLGLSYQALQADARNDLLLSAQLNNPNDNVENWNFGVEYIWNELLALRTGYRFGIEEFTVPSFGVGLMLPYLGPDLRFDYGYSQLERLGQLHRVSLMVGL